MGKFNQVLYYLCFWDSKNATAYYHKKHWTERTDLCLGKRNVKYNLLINSHSKVSEAKVEAGVFIGPLVRKKEGKIILGEFCCRG